MIHTNLQSPPAPELEPPPSCFHRSDHLRRPRARLPRDSQPPAPPSAPGRAVVSPGGLLPAHSEHPPHNRAKCRIVCQTQGALTARRAGALKWSTTALLSKCKSIPAGPCSANKTRIAASAPYGPAHKHEPSQAQVAPSHSPPSQRSYHRAMQRNQTRDAPIRLKRRMSRPKPDRYAAGGHDPHTSYLEPDHSGAGRHRD